MYSAFLDVVGTRATAKTSFEDYNELLGLFHQAVFEVCHELEPQGERSSVFFFSDCAFARDRKLSRLLKFLSQLRSQLLVESVFLRAAVSAGDLEESEAHTFKTIEDDDLREIVKSRVRGYYFGPLAAQLYGAEESLKGIGIRLDEKLLNSKRARSRSSTTCYVPDTSSRQAVPYSDIKLGRSDLSSQNLDNVLSAFYRAKTVSKRLARYYIPLLVLWIRSLEAEDFSQIGPTQDGNLVSVIVNGGFDKLFGDVVGVEQVRFSLVDRMLAIRSEIPQQTITKIWAYVESHRSMIKNIRFVPE